MCGLSYLQMGKIRMGLLLATRVLEGVRILF